MIIDDVEAPAARQVKSIESVAPVLVVREAFTVTSIAGALSMNRGALDGGYGGLGGALRPVLAHSKETSCWREFLAFVSGWFRVRDGGAIPLRGNGGWRAINARPNDAPCLL